MTDHSEITPAGSHMRPTAAPTRQAAQPQMSVNVLLVAGAVACAVSFFIVDQRVSYAILAFGTAIAIFAIAVGIARRIRASRWKVASEAVISLVENDASACFLTDNDGCISFRNEAANEKFRDRAVETLGRAFSELFANPVAVLFRLQSKAQALGSAREDIVTRKGHVRLSVNSLDGSAFLWRLEDLSDRGGGTRAADALSLPMLTAGPSGTVLYMNEAFRWLLGGRAKNLNGLFTDLPLVSGQVHKVQCESGEIESLVAEVPSHGGRREIYLLPGDNLPSGQIGPTDWNAIEELPVPLLKVAVTGEVLSSNHEARVLLANKIGPQTRISDLLKGLGRPLVDWLAETIEGRGASTPQFLQSVNNDTETFLQLSLNPAGDAQEPYVIAVLSDVTEFKNL